MADHTSSPQVSSDIRFTPRSITPGPTFLRTPQPRKLLTGRIVRKRSTSAPISELNRQAIWEDILLNSQPLALPAPSTPIPIDSVPSLISSVSSTPSPSSLRTCFPESLTLPSTVNPLWSESSLSEFDSSMEFALPPSYNLGTFASSYQSSYLGSLSGDEKNSMASSSSDQHSTYAPSYVQSPAPVGASPAMHGRSVSEDTDPVHDAYSYPHNYSYPPAPASNQLPEPSYGYSHQNTLPVTSGYQPSSSDPRSHASYGYTYGQQPPSYQQQPSYMSYGSVHGMHHMGAHQDRVTEPPKEQRCWEHGCNGRLFSTHSNLLRHQREKGGSASKATCPYCGATFTRRTAMNGHITNGKCRRKTGNSTPASLSPPQSDR